jgi:hypothetical protein
MSLWGLTDALVSAPKWLTKTESFLAADVDGTAKTITIANHGLEDLSQVTVTGATTGIKFIKVVGDVIKVYDSLSNATANGAGGLQSLSEADGTIQITPSDVYFIDSTEATLKANQDKGFDAPGWYQYSTYTDAGSVVRHKAELLCAFGDGNATDAGDAGVDGADEGDSVGFDREITLGATTVTPENPDIDGNASFTVGIAVTQSGAAGGTQTFQWSFSTDGGSSFTDCNVADSSDNTATMTVASGDTDEYVNGIQFRCTVGLTDAQTRVSVPVTIVKA